jgi:hypothetical protein
MEDYVIQPKDEGKGRSFSATCVAFATADSLWESGGKTIRPVWAMFATSDAELKPFMANLKLGRKAEKASNAHQRRGGDEERLEFLKSAGYQITWQRAEEGSIATIFHPDLFRLDPGMVDPSGIKFVLIVPTDLSDAQQLDVESAVKHVHPMFPTLDVAFLSSLVPTACLFAAFLDRRTRCPLVADTRFYLQLLVASLDRGFASLPGRNARYNNTDRDWGLHSGHGFNLEIGGQSYARQGIETIGLKHAISVFGSHEVFEAFLADEVTLFFERTKQQRPRARLLAARG